MTDISPIPINPQKCLALVYIGSKAHNAKFWTYFIAHSDMSPVQVLIQAQCTAAAMR